MHPIELAPAILAEEVAGAAILLRILVRREQIERGHNLSTNRRDRVVRYYEDKIIAANVPDKSVLAAGSLHHVVQKLGENADHAIPLVVAVAIVEFLEVIEIRVANSEVITDGESTADFGFDRRRTSQARRWMHDEVSLGADKHRRQPAYRLRRLHPLAQDFIRACVKRFRKRLGLLAAQNCRGNDAGIGILFQPVKSGEDRLRVSTRIEYHEPRARAQSDRHQLVGGADGDDGTLLRFDPRTDVRG